MLWLLQIRLRVGVQVGRSPLAHDHTPWTWWMPVEGVTTPPITSSPPSTTPSKGPAGNGPIDILQKDTLLPC